MKEKKRREKEVGVESGKHAGRLLSTNRGRRREEREFMRVKDKQKREKDKRGRERLGKGTGRAGGMERKKSSKE